MLQKYLCKCICIFHISSLMIIIDYKSTLIQGISRWIYFRKALLLIHHLIISTMPTFTSSTVSFIYHQRLAHLKRSSLSFSTIVIKGQKCTYLSRNNIYTRFIRSYWSTSTRLNYYYVTARLDWLWWLGNGIWDWDLDFGLRYGD